MPTISYGWVTSQYLPIRDFRWLRADEIAKLNIMDLKDDANIGYILEVDLGEFDSFFEMVISTCIFLSKLSTNFLYFLMIYFTF